MWVSIPEPAALQGFASNIRGNLFRDSSTNRKLFQFVASSVHFLTIETRALVPELVEKGGESAYGDCYAFLPGELFGVVVTRISVPDDPHARIGG